MVKSAKFDFVGEMAKMLPRMLREFSRRQEGILTRGNLAVSDIIVMDALLEMGTCTMGVLAKMLNLTKSAATVIVDRMIRKGFVRRERSNEDRRVVSVVLLKKGEDMIRRVNEERRNMLNEFYSALNESERKEYIKLLKKVFGSLSGKQ
jgi:DNA-binding MarR family transcriptional regulator